MTTCDYRLAKFINTVVLPQIMYCEHADLVRIRNFLMGSSAVTIKILVSSDSYIYGTFKNIHVDTKNYKTLDLGLSVDDIVCAPFSFSYYDLF